MAFLEEKEKKNPKQPILKKHSIQITFVLYETYFDHICTFCKFIFYLNQKCGSIA